jgi:hypothetical protein
VALPRTGLRNVSQRTSSYVACAISLSAQAVGGPDDEDTIPEFVPLSIWRRHLVFSIVAIPLTFYLAWSFVLITTLFVAMFIPFSNPTWSPLVSWSVGILVGLFVLFWLVLCFSNWHRMFLCLLYPIHWLLTRRGLRIS